MIDTSMVISLSNKLQNLKTNNKTEDLKVEDKSDFKEYLSKEVNLKTEKSIDNSSKEIESNNEFIENNEEKQLTTEELYSEISEKIEDVLNNEDLINNTNDEALEEILSLLVNLLKVNIKDFTNDNTSALSEINADNIGSTYDITNMLTKEDNNLIINLNEDITSNDSKEVLKNIDSLIQEYLNASKENEALILSKPIKEIKTELIDEVKKLINIMPDNSIENMENNLQSDISKEILNTLILNTNKESEPIYEKSKNYIEENDFNGEKIINTTDTMKLDEAVDNSKDNINKENLSEDKASKNTNVNKEEEKILMKFLDDDNNQSFAKTLNYYDKLNKINSNVEVIKEPIAISKETINLDIIKNVKYMMKNAIEELKVKIYPKELGEMTIKILSEEGIMKAEIKATSKETYNLLNSNLNEIKKVLENQNIRIQEVNIGIYNEDTTFFSGKEGSRDNLKEFNSKREENLFYEEDEILEDLLIDNNVNFLA